MIAYKQEECCEIVKEIANVLHLTPPVCNPWPPSNSPRTFLDRCAKRDKEPAVCAKDYGWGNCISDDVPSDKPNRCEIQFNPLFFNLMGEKDVLMSNQCFGVRNCQFYYSGNVKDIVSFGLDRDYTFYGKVVEKGTNSDAIMLNDIDMITEDISGGRRYMPCEQSLPNGDIEGCSIPFKDIIFGKVPPVNLHTLQDSISNRGRDQVINSEIECIPQYENFGNVRLKQYCSAVLGGDPNTEVEFVPTVDSVGYIGNEPSPVYEEPSILEIGFSSATQDCKVKIRENQCPSRFGITDEDGKTGTIIANIFPTKIDIKITNHSLMPYSYGWDNPDLLNEKFGHRPPNWPYYIEIEVSDCKAAPMPQKTVDFAGNTRRDGATRFNLWKTDDSIKETWQSVVGGEQGKFIVQAPCEPVMVCKMPYLQAVCRAVQPCAPGEICIDETEIVQDGFYYEFAPWKRTTPPDWMDPNHPSPGLGCYGVAYDIADTPDFVHTTFYNGEEIPEGESRFVPGVIVSDWGEVCPSTPSSTPGCFTDGSPNYDYSRWFDPVCLTDMPPYDTVHGYKNWRLDQGDVQTEIENPTCNVHGPTCQCNPPGQGPPPYCV